MRTLERTLALALMAVGAVGIYAASGLSLWDEYTVGPGATPIIYGIGVLVCGAWVLARPAAPSAIDLGPLFTRAVILAVLMAALAASLDYIGFTVGLFAFSLAALLLVSRMKVLPAILFASIWVALLYGGFVYLLKIPFPRGAFF